MIRMFNYPPLFLVLNLIMGILCASYLSLKLDTLLTLVIIIGVAMIGVLILKKFTRFSFGLELLIYGIAFLILGIATVTFSDVWNTENYFGKLIDSEHSRTFTAEIDEVLRSNKSFNRFVVKVEQVGSEAARGKAIINVRRDSSFTTAVGTRYLIHAYFDEVNTPLNPGQFDYAAYLARQQIYHQAFVEFSEMKLLPDNSNSILVELSKLRSELIDLLIKNGIKSQELGVMSALLLGERDYLSTELRNSYIDAGAIHILAISGLHIGILFLMLSFLLKPLRQFKYGRELSQIIIVGILWLFAMLAGLSSSVVRAVTMFSFISLGLLLNRRNSVYESLIASAFVLLLVHPRFLFDVGFQLSYSAVFSIVWLQPKLEHLWKPKFRVVNYFWKLFTVSCAAQLGVLPLSLFYFHQFPALFFVSNLVIVPLLGLLLGVGMLVLILVYFDLSPAELTMVYGRIIELMNGFIGWVSGFEEFVIQYIYWSVGLLMSSYVLIITFFKFTEKKSLFRLGLAGVSILMFYCVLFYETNNQKRHDEFIIFHQSRRSVIGTLNGQRFDVMGIKGRDEATNIDGFLSAKGVKEVTYTKEISNLILTKNQSIVVVDSIGLYEFKSIQEPVVLLRNSPKINLERLIQELNPTEIIADGSNYKSYVRKWEQSALKTKTPFHDTSQKGAYILK